MYFGFELFGLLVLLLIVAYAFGMAMVVRNVNYILQNPFSFVFECVLWFILPALPIFYFTISKNLRLYTATKWYVIAGCTVVTLNALFHISGFYDYLFGNVLAPPM